MVLSSRSSDVCLLFDLPNQDPTSRAVTVFRTESQRGSIMTIYSIQQRFGDRLRGWLALCGITTLGAAAMLSGTAHGQTPIGYGFPSATTQTAGGAMAYGGDHYRVVNAASFQQSGATATNQVMRANGLAENSLLAAGSVAAVSYSEGCATCGSSGCNGSCGGAMAGGGLGGGGYGGMDYQPRFGSGMPTACGTPCNPYQYALIEGLYMRRAGEERTSLSPNMVLDGFDYEWAPRITVGAVPDCQRGYEFSFIGVYDWDQSASLTAAPGTRIRTSLVDGLGVDSGSLIAFVNTPARGAIPAGPAVPGVSPEIPAVAARPESFSNFQSQTYDSQLYSMEASRTLVGYDLVKVLYGARYISLDEDLNYYSQNNLGNTGQLLSSTQNRLLGGQIGIDALYPVSCHGSVDFRGRAGAYLDFAENDFTLVNEGAAVLANSDEDAQIAGFFELGAGMRYQLGEALTLRAGGEFWYLTGVATAPNQFSDVIASNTGSDINVNDDIFFLGLSVGAEFKF